MLRKLQLVNAVALALLCVGNFAVSLSFFYQRRYVSAALVAGLALILYFATSHYARQTDIPIAKRIVSLLKEILGWSYALFMMVGVPFALYINRHPILFWTYSVLIICATVSGFRKRIRGLRPDKLRITQAGAEYVHSPAYALEIVGMVAQFWKPEASFYELLIYKTAISLSEANPATLEPRQFRQFVSDNLLTIRTAIDRIKISQPSIRLSEESWEKAAGLLPTESSADTEFTRRLDELFPNPSGLSADDSSLHVHPDETCAATLDESEVLRILIVDDEPAILETLGALLVGWGHEAVPKLLSNEDDAKKIIEAVKRTPFDVVISDVIMPAMTGLHLFELLAPISPTTLFIFSDTGPCIECSSELRKKGLWVEPLLQPFEHQHLQALLNRVSSGA